MKTVIENLLAEYDMSNSAFAEDLREALVEQPAQQEPVAGCACRWSSEGDRVVTCERHQGWLEVIAEWADRARDAEKKLKALNTSPPAQRNPLTAREIELIDGMIEVQLDHAARCDNIPNRVMAKKQKRVGHGARGTAA